MKKTTRRKRRTSAGKPRKGRRQRSERGPVGQHNGKQPEAVPSRAREQSVVPPEMEQQSAGPNNMEDQAAGPDSPMGPATVPIKTEPQDDIPFEGPSHPFIRVKIEKENRVVQTESPPLGIIRDRNSRQRSVKIQVKLPASEKAWKRDPKTKALRHKMKQARQEADQLREQMIPREEYEKLQQETE